jgi:hypothetical protein
MAEEARKKKEYKKHHKENNRTRHYLYTQERKMGKGARSWGGGALGSRALRVESED